MNSTNRVSKVTSCVLMALLLAIIADKLLFFALPFWGLENEDAFIYADTARFMLYDYPWSIEPFMTKAVADGSYTNPISTVSYATHYETLSFAISLLHKIFGYWVYTPLFISSLCGIATMLVLCSMTFKNRSYDKWQVILCILAYATSPLARSFQGSGVSEAVSCLFVLLTIIHFIKLAYLSENDKISFLFVIACSMAFIAAIMIKRENLALLILPALAVLINRSLLKKGRFFAILSILFTSTAILVFFAPTLESLSAERDDISTPAFSISHFVCNAPRFLECMIRPDMWGITGLLLFLAILCARKRLIQPNILFPLIMLCVYFGLYTFHFRSQYQVASGDVTAFEMMRFSTNIFPIAVLIIMSISIPDYLRNKSYTTCIFATVFLIMCIYSTKQKIRLSNIEFDERTEPILHAISRCNASDVLVTDVHSLARLHAKDNQDIMAMMFLSRLTIKEKAKNSVSNFWVVHRPDERDSITKLFKSESWSEIESVSFHSYDVTHFKNL
jgi:hypothetical protein